MTIWVELRLNLKATYGKLRQLYRSAGALFQDTYTELLTDAGLPQDQITTEQAQDAENAK